MKLRPIFTSLLSVLVLAALSCHQDTIIDPKAEGSSAKVVSDSIDYEAEGIFMYKTLKFHSSHFDAYTLLSEKERPRFKAIVDSVQSLHISDPNLI